MRPCSLRSVCGSLGLVDAALTGGLAIAAHLHARGQAVRRRSWNDIDVVIAGMHHVPQSLAADFLCNKSFQALVGLGEPGQLEAAWAGGDGFRVTDAAPTATSFRGRRR